MCVCFFIKKKLTFNWELCWSIVHSKFLTMFYLETNEEESTSNTLTIRCWCYSSRKSTDKNHICSFKGFRLFSCKSFSIKNRQMLTKKMLVEKNQSNWTCFFFHSSLRLSKKKKKRRRRRRRNSRTKLDDIRPKRRKKKKFNNKEEKENDLCLKTHWFMIFFLFRLIRIIRWIELEEFSHLAMAKKRNKTKKNNEKNSSIEDPNENEGEREEKNK